MKRKQETYILLHNIRSIHNVGSIFRTAECLGITNILLIGYTPAPIDRFGRLRKDFAKVALGAERNVPWKHFPKIESALKFLKKQKVYLVAVEQRPKAIDYKKLKVKFPAAFIFGNEVEGLPDTILARMDAVAEIPMRGEKESLNVAVAAGIALARILNR